jgi:hypothetical protein
MVLDATLTVAGGSHGFLFTDDQDAARPRRRTGSSWRSPTTRVNQVMSNFWSGRWPRSARMARVCLGIYDAIRLEALLPPIVVRRGADGALQA